MAPFPDFPLIDYSIGDTVHVSIPSDIDADYRSLAIAMREGDSPCDLRVTIELNSLDAEYLASIQRAMIASLAAVPPNQAAQSGLASTTATGDSGTLTINSITDISVDTPADNEVLAYDSGSGNWINQTAAEAGLLSGTILTTKGDLLTFGTAIDRLPIGTADGYVLKVDGSATYGLTWGTVPAAGNAFTFVSA